MKSFKEFLAEANEPKPDALKTITRNWEKKHKGLTAQASLTPSGAIRLHNIFVPKSKQGKGIGSRFMKGLGRYADKTQKQTRLSQSAEPGRERDLSRFYRKFNFKKDRNTTDTYVRNPQ
jgi:GNAT superfamily N-acetyltransferase